MTPDGWSITEKTVEGGIRVAVKPTSPISYDNSDPCRGFSLYASTSQREAAIEAAESLASFAMAKGRLLTAEEASQFWPRAKLIASADEIARMIQQEMAKAGCVVPIEQIVVKPTSAAN